MSAWKNFPTVSCNKIIEADPMLQKQTNKNPVTIKQMLKFLKRM